EVLGVLGKGIAQVGQVHLDSPFRRRQIASRANQKKEGGRSRLPTPRDEGGSAAWERRAALEQQRIRRLSASLRPCASCTGTARRSAARRARAALRPGSGRRCRQ